MGRELDLPANVGFSDSGSLWLSLLIFSPTESLRVAESTTTPLSPLASACLASASAGVSLLSGFSFDASISLAIKEKGLWNGRQKR